MRMYKLSGMKRDNLLSSTFILTPLLLYLLLGCAAPQKQVRPLKATIDTVIDTLASEITRSLSPEQRPKIAVVDLLGPNDIHTQLGSFISEKLITRLFKSGRFEKVLERKLLQDLLVQQRIEMEGYFDQESVKSIVGKIGIDALVMGYITDYGQKVDLNVRLIDTTGQILSVAEARIEKDQSVINMIQSVKTATLTIALNPPDADGSVTVAERVVRARNGIAVFRDLPQGTRSIIITSKGYEMVQESVYITADRTITIPLPPKKLALTIRVTPHHGEILLDGERKGYASGGVMVLSGVASGRHTILARAEGYLPQRKEIEVHEDTTLSMNLFSDPLVALAKLTQKKPSFTFEVWTGKKHYKVGEEIRFNFRSDRDCYLTLVDYETNGNVKILFPNRYYQENFIKGGKTYTIPGSDYGFKLTIVPPPGVEKLKAIATTKPFSLFDLSFAKDLFPQVDRTNTRGMRGISIALDRLPKLDWAESTCTIVIE